MSPPDIREVQTSRWTSQLVIKIAVIAAVVGCLGPLVFALVRSGTRSPTQARKVATVGQVSLNSSPAVSSAQPPLAQPSSHTATVPSTVPDAVATSTTVLASATTTSSTVLGSAGAPQVDVVTVADADDGKTIVLRKGQRLRVVLSGPTWQFAEPSDKDVLAQQGQQTYTPGENCTPLPGSHCGTVTAEFKALKIGASVVTAARAPCVQCSDDRNQYRLDVRVRS
jgi:hypothetical protein